MERKKTQIFPAKINNSQGLTLIEVMVVLSIIVILISVGAPRLSRSFGNAGKTTTRNIVMLTKQLHSSAKLKNKTYRLVIQFPDTEKRTPAQFYVESASNSQLIETEESQKNKSSFDKDKEVSPFTPDPMVKKPVVLPSNLQFSSVENEAFSKPITEGKAYIHFFPQGLIERSVIHLTDSQGRESSLIINPLTGRTDVEPSRVTLKELTQ